LLPHAAWNQGLGLVNCEYWLVKLFQDLYLFVVWFNIYNVHVIFNNNGIFSVPLDRDSFMAGPEKSVARTPVASIFSCQASANRQSLAQLGKCLLRLKFAKYVCAHAWWVSQLKNIYFLLRIYTYNLWYKAACECQLCLKPRFHISGMWMQHCSMCFVHPSHILTYFSWEWLSGHSNWVIEFWLQPSGLLHMHI